MPVRVQRRRSAGWRAPEGARYVGRGTRFGNPWAVVQAGDGWNVNWAGPTGTYPPNGAYAVRCAYRVTAHEQAVRFYAEWLVAQPALLEAVRRDLAGRDLMCWCAESLPCHADVLLDLANR